MSKHGTVVRFGGVLTALLLTAASCSHDSNQTPTPEMPASAGSIRLRIETARVSAGEVTRVTIDTSSGISADLARDPDTGAFTGALVLPVGPTELIGRAFIDTTQVAESAPVPVDVQEGAVTDVTIRLLDQTGNDDVDHGPFVVSLVHPASAVAGQPVAFSVSAVDPDGDAVSFAWSDDCEDSSFSAPDSATTDWVKPAEGACNVSITASANGLSRTESFSVVVFQEAGNTGAVNVDGVFVSAPQIAVELGYSARCTVFPGVPDGSCPEPIEAGSSASLFAFVDWANAQPGELTISDDCGGAFDLFTSDPFVLEGMWTAPAEQAVCLVTARATSPDGVSGTISAALLVKPPVTPPPPPPAAYQRMSLRPLYQLTPQSQFGRFEVLGEVMRVSDFQSAFVQTSAEQRLNELGQQIGFERGSAPIDLFIDAENRSRAAAIPFRGKPSDVKHMRVDGVNKAYVPLGGTINTPGNEVTSVNLDSGIVQRIRVGIRPQRVAVHEASGLVFVCNQMSNYISIIDARFDELLEADGAPVEIPTDFYCADLALVERDPVFGHPDELFLYVANTWRGSVLKYSIDIVRDINDAVHDVDINAPPGQTPDVPLAEITGVGKAPARLHVDETQSRVYVASQRGGEVAVFGIADDQVLNRVALNAPAMDLVQIADKLYVPTTTPFRGLLNGNSSVVPSDVDGPPVELTGVDGQSHLAHPGALFDQTDSYNYEDLRNGIFVLTNSLVGTPSYLTDDNEADDSFAAAQMVLAGALPQAMVRNQAGTRVYVALAGSDLIQEMNVVSGQFRLQPTGMTFQTRARPVALALDEDEGRLLSVAWGGEVLETFDLGSGTRLDERNLGYAQPAYPATRVEAGESFFYTAKWSNDGRKACASCHVGDSMTDGLGFSNGTIAPTAYHQIKPVRNLAGRDVYFWNGSFANGSQASLAFAAQTRTNCELVLYGLVEGVDSDPFTRIGDPLNYTANAAQDASCRPDTGFLIDGLPGNLDGQDFVDGIQPIIAEQRDLAGIFAAFAVQDELLRAGLNVDRDEVIRSLDFYSVAELRLPPNPLSEMRSVGMLPQDLSARLDNGEQIFRDQANCDSCHDPDNFRAPFTDNRVHGRGANWVLSFINTYDQDPRLLELLPNGTPEPMLFSAFVDSTPQEVDFHYNPLDFFLPFCFDGEVCLRFDDPLAVRGAAAEDERLRRLIRLNLADPDRGFLPGQVVGQSRVATPSLRGVWSLGNLLRHGHATSVREAILPPGHEALEQGELGWAVDNRNNFDVHGQVSQLTPAEIEDLVLFVQSIE